MLLTERTQVESFQKTSIGCDRCRRSCVRRSRRRTTRRTLRTRRGANRERCRNPRIARPLLSRACCVSTNTRRRSWPYSPSLLLLLRVVHWGGNSTEFVPVVRPRRPFRTSPFPSSSSSHPLDLVRGVVYAESGAVGSVMIVNETCCYYYYYYY